MTCNKRPWPSAKAARRFNGRSRGGKRHRIGQTLRVYWCAECVAYHATKERSNTVMKRTEDT